MYYAVVIVLLVLVLVMQYKTWKEVKPDESDVVEVTEGLSLGPTGLPMLPKFRGY